jgi:hypothetical protein
VEQINAVASMVDDITVTTALPRSNLIEKIVNRIRKNVIDRTKIETQNEYFVLCTSTPLSIGCNRK